MAATTVGPLHLVVGLAGQVDMAVLRQRRPCTPRVRLRRRPPRVVLPAILAVAPLVTLVATVILQVRVVRALVPRYRFLPDPIRCAWLYSQANSSRARLHRAFPVVVAV